MGPVLLSARILPFGSASVGGCPPFLVFLFYIYFFYDGHFFMEVYRQIVIFFRGAIFSDFSRVTTDPIAAAMASCGLL